MLHIVFKIECSILNKFVLLPAYLFWQKVYALFDRIHGYSLNECSGNVTLIKLIFSKKPSRFHKQKAILLLQPKYFKTTHSLLTGYLEVYL